MSKEAAPDNLSMATAEEVLRTIYGDDLKGCTVRLEDVGRIIQQSADQRGFHELIDLYEKLVEAVHLLSTPPGPGLVSGPEQLQALLGQRLDTIHNLTTKTLQTTAPFRRASAEGEGE